MSLPHPAAGGESCKQDSYFSISILFYIIKIRVLKSLSAVPLDIFHKKVVSIVRGIPITFLRQKLFKSHLRKRILCK